MSDYIKSVLVFILFSLFLAFCGYLFRLELNLIPDELRDSVVGAIKGGFIGTVFGIIAGR